MKAFKLVFMLAILGLGLPLITACENEEGGFEEMGENIDETGEQFGDTIENTTDN